MTYLARMVGLILFFYFKIDKLFEQLNFDQQFKKKGKQNSGKYETKRFEWMLKNEQICIYAEGMMTECIYAHAQCSNRKSADAKTVRGHQNETQRNK